MSNNSRSKLSRRDFLRLTGTIGVSAATLATLNACVAPSAPAPAEAPAAKPAAVEPTKAPAAAKGGTVKWAEFYSLLTDENGKINQDWIAKIIKQFQDENPGWKVEQEGIKWDQIDQKSILDLAAGVDHDLMFSSPQLMAKHAKTGDYVDMSPYIKTMPKEDVADLDWSPGWKSATVNGQQIGIATGVHTRTTAYRADWFKTAGVDPKSLSTLDGMVEAAKKLTQADKDVWGLGLYAGPSRATIELYYGTVVWALGGDYYDEKTKKATVTGEASLKAIKWIYDCIFTWKVTPPYAFAPDADYGNLINDNLIKGKLAMGMGFGSYWIGAVQAKDMLKGCFPATKDCQPGSVDIAVTPGAAFTNAWCLSIHKLSKQPEAAFKLLQVILKPENLKTYPDAGLPGRLSAWKAPEYNSAFYQTWLDAAKKGKGVPATPYYAELADGVAAAIQEVLSKKADIATTMKKFEDEWNAKFGGQ